MLNPLLQPVPSFVRWLGTIVMEWKCSLLFDKIAPISKEAGYNIIEARDEQILPVSELSKDNQKLIIFYDFVSDKNQNPLIEYFV